LQDPQGRGRGTPARSRSRVRLVGCVKHPRAGHRLDRPSPASGQDCGRDRLQSSGRSLEPRLNESFAELQNAAVSNSSNHRKAGTARRRRLVATLVRRWPSAPSNRAATVS
jgi:hypothetical protein